MGQNRRLRQKYETSNLGQRIYNLANSLSFSFLPDTTFKNEEVVKCLARDSTSYKLENPSSDVPWIWAISVLIIVLSINVICSLVEFFYAMAIKDKENKPKWYKLRVFK